MGIRGNEVSMEKFDSFQGAINCALLSPSPGGW
jgi:hypothetical protein